MRIATGHDQAADFIGNWHDLVHADASLVAVCTAIAATRPEHAQTVGDRLFGKAFFAQCVGGDVEQFTAVLAQSPRQALRDDQAHRGGQSIGFDTHVYQPRQRLRRIVGVQCG